MGYPHPDQLLASMTSRQFAEWQAYATLEPWGEDRADLRAGIISSTVANFAGKSMKEGSSLAPVDFMPYAEKPKREKARSSDVLRAQFAHLVKRKDDT
ncbi:MAG: hypothetical protein R6U98_24280 [Pirellulaceae bacterium]